MEDANTEIPEEMKDDESVDLGQINHSLIEIQAQILVYYHALAFKGEDHGSIMLSCEDDFDYGLRKCLETMYAELGKIVEDLDVASLSFRGFNA